MSANFAQTVLSASLASGGTSLVVSTPSAPFTVPVAGAGRITLVNNAFAPTVMEIIAYTGRTDNGNGTFAYTGLSRGIEGTAPAAWSAGATVLQSLTAGQYAADLVGKAATDDVRLSDAREWTAETVSQVEAEAGTAAIRRAWTALAVKQAVSAWFFSVTSGFGRAWTALADIAAARDALGLGSAAFTETTAYQAPLVSGTTIKTINGVAVLGAGDLVIAGGGGGVSQAAFDTLEGEIVAARGSRDALGERIGVISNFASPNAGGIVPGRYYDGSFHANTLSSSSSGVVDRFELFPFYSSVTMPIDRIGALVVTAVASSLIKISIYDTGTDGWPNNLLLETGDIDAAVVGLREATVAFTFQSGLQYWIGVRNSSTSSLRTTNAGSLVNLGLASSTSTSFNNKLQRTLAYATPAPAAWGFVATDLANIAVPTHVRFRAA